MSNEQRVLQLLDEILHSERSPEEVCAQCPDLLEEVRKRWLAILAAPGPTRETPKVRTLPHESLGAHIGPYKLLQQIGEGGFGIVYMAEQDRPVHRRVGLKIIVQAQVAPCAVRDSAYSSLR
jgi:hypothetical protein